MLLQVSANAGGPWSDSITVGYTVYYQITVDNTGNTALSGVTVNDGMTECVLSGPTGDANSNNLLDVDETWLYTCSVTATADSNETVEISDGADYFGNAPMIGVAKRVIGTPVEMTAGTWDVTYEICLSAFVCNSAIL